MKWLKTKIGILNFVNKIIENVGLNDYGIEI